MTRVRGVRRRRTTGPLRLAIVSVALAACGSLVKMEPAAADGPRISGLEIATARPVAGCPVRFRLHLDAGADDRMLAGIGWVLFLGMPSLARIFVDIRADQLQRDLHARAKHLVQEWGEEVTGKAKPGS